MYLSVSVSLLASFPYARAIPALDFSPIDTNPLGQPFINAVLPVEHDYRPRSNLFRRQGCPNSSLLCPSGLCCSYDTSCCGSSCCPSGYLCTGGTEEAPCCVAINAASNECGGSNSNPCARPGDLPCNGINICCPPDNACYYDSNNFPRCSPLSTSPSPPATTPYTAPVTTPIITTIKTSIIATEPAPITTTNPYSYSGTSPSSSPSSNPGTFWTPAAIGGITGGAVAGVILLCILIYICYRQHHSSSEIYIDESRVRTLTNREIYWLVKDLETPKEWQEAYISEAKRIQAGVHIDHASWMKDFGTRAVETRIQQLREGGERNKSMWKAGGIAAIPFVKYWGWFRDSTKHFNRVAIDALGMGNANEVKELYNGAKAAANRSSLLAKLLPGVEWVGKHAFKEWWAESDLAAQLQQEMAAYLTDELGQEAGMTLMAELVHIKLGLGQVISGCRAMWKCDQKMLKALEWLQAAAIDFHLSVFAINALTEVFPQEFKVESGEKQLFVGIERVDHID